MTMKELNKLEYGDVVKNVITNIIRTVKQTYTDGVSLSANFGEPMKTIGNYNCSEWTLWSK